MNNILEAITNNWIVTMAVVAITLIGIAEAYFGRNTND